MAVAIDILEAAAHEPPPGVASSSSLDHGPNNNDNKKHTITATDGLFLLQVAFSCVIPPTLDHPLSPVHPPPPLSEVGSAKL